MNYEELVKALRCCAEEADCSNCPRKGGDCIYGPDGLLTDAAAAIEALQAEQKKTVTQIFCEEQMAWEGRCKDLMKHISDLQAEVKRLKDSNEELREKQTFIDHYGAEWITNAKDVPTAAYEHGYADGWAEARAKMEVQDESAGSL